MAKRIEFWPVDRLVPYARNARTHSDEKIAHIAASIAEFGFNNPLLVDTNSGLIAGHGRLLAARKLGLDQIPVVVLDHLSETQKRAYILADNRIGENAAPEELVHVRPDSHVGAFGEHALHVPVIEVARSGQRIEARPGGRHLPTEASARAEDHLVAAADQVGRDCQQRADVALEGSGSNDDVGQ